MTSSSGSYNGNCIPSLTRSRTTLNRFFDALVTKYQLYVSNSSEEDKVTIKSILTLIDPDKSYFEPYGSQLTATSTKTIHLGQELDDDHLSMDNFLYIRSLSDTNDAPSKIDTNYTHTATHQQDLDDLATALSSIHQQYHESKEDDIDIGLITKAWKQKVLDGVTCTFSGLIPSDQDPLMCRFWKLASTYGAHCSLELTGKVTHLIASRTGTAKVNKAKHYQQRIHSVAVAWLLDSVSRGRCQEEDLYPLVSSLPASTVVTPVTTPLGNEDELLLLLEQQEAAKKKKNKNHINGNEDDHRIEPQMEQEDQSTYNEQALEEDVHDIDHIDWDEADKEVNDYMNESGTDDNYSSGPDSPVPDGKGQTPTGSRKRKRNATPTATAGQVASSPLAIRRAKTAERGPSRLSTMVNMNDPTSINNDNGDDDDSSSSSSSSLSSFAGELDDEIE
ncbi:unnamed protein product [Absidia cylindrospora]